MLTFEHPFMDYEHNGIKVRLKLDSRQQHIADRWRNPIYYDIRLDWDNGFSGEKYDKMYQVGIAPTHNRYWLRRKYRNTWHLWFIFPYTRSEFIESNQEYIDRIIESVNEHIDRRVALYEEHIKEFNKIKEEYQNK